MKAEDITNGWVIASMDGTYVLPYTFERTRTDSIAKWMSLWDKDRCSWRKFKREGYKCVKAVQSTKISTT